MTGGLWPAELSTITAETATLAQYLKEDLQRIANSANDELKVIKRAGMTDLARQAEEARVIDEARARAARRVESTIRHLHAMEAKLAAEYPRPPIGERSRSKLDETQVIAAVTDTDAPVRPRWRIAQRDRHQAAGAATERFEVGRPEVVDDDAGGAAASSLEETQVIPVVSELEPVVEARVEAGRHQAAGAARERFEVGRPEVVDDDAGGAAASSLEETQVIPVVSEVEPVVEARVEAGRHQAAGAARERFEVGRPEVVDDDAGGAAASSLEDTQVIPVVSEVEPVVEARVEAGRHQAAGAARERFEVGRSEVVDDDAGGAAASSVEETQVIPVVSEVEPVVEAPVQSGRHHALPAGTQETRAETTADTNRLNRLLEFVVRQEPRLNWAIGEGVDGTPVLVTDLAHGWIPPGIALPAGVRLLAPERRTGKVSALIGDTVQAMTYAPGDSLRRSADFAATKSSSEPRRLPEVEHLGRVLSEATRGHDGLPRIVHRLADAAAAGTGVIDQEVDVLRVHLDTVRYQLLVQYPAVNPALLLDCLLLAATESFAVGDSISANYHLAWYQHLAAPPRPQE